MTPAGPVHFIYLGGPFRWQHWRAIRTAAIHGAPIYIWTAEEPDEREHWDAIAMVAADAPLVAFRELDLPDWLRDHPIRLANVKDLFAWRILYEHGGLYLDLDTISLRPAWDLLPKDRDVLVSTEHDDDYRDDHPYNSAAVIARPYSSVVEMMAATALRVLRNGETQWGACGPRLLTRFVSGYPEHFAAAPFGTLNGWRDGTIRRYYAGESPGADVRIVHLFSSSNMDAFLADRWMP